MRDFLDTFNAGQVAGAAVGIILRAVLNAVLKYAGDRRAEDRRREDERGIFFRREG